MDFFGPEAVARAGRDRMEAFFQSLGLATTLAGLGVTSEYIDEMAYKCTDRATQAVGNFVKLDRQAVKEILLAVV